MSQENVASPSIEKEKLQPQPDQFRKELKNRCFNSLQELQAANPSEIQLTDDALAEWMKVSRRTLDMIFRVETLEPRRGTREKFKQFLEIEDAELDRLLANTESIGAAIPEAPPPRLHIPNTESTTGLRKYWIGLLLTSFLLGLLFLLKNQFTNVTTDTAHYDCVVDLTLKLPNKLLCQNFGILKIVGESRKNWATKTSVIEVPENWQARARFEHWDKATNYQTIKENGAGYFLLDPGTYLLKDRDFILYSDRDTTSSLREVEAPEANDRIQYLIVSKADNIGTLIIRNHSDDDHPDFLEITFEPSM